MKEFLRYLFVVATMLMVAVGDVWGQKPVCNNGTWYSLYDEGTITLNTIDNESRIVFPPTQTTLTFDAKRDPLGQDPLQVAPIVNGAQKDNIFSQNPGLVTDKTIFGTEKTVEYFTYTPSLFETNATELKFYTTRGATLKKYITNVKLPLARHILIANDGFGKSSEIVTFENTIIGATSSEKVVNLRSFLTTGNITITSSNPNVFRVMDKNNTSPYTFNVGANACAASGGSGNAGGGNLGDISKYAIKIYFCPTEVKDYSGTITVSDGTSTATINVSGTGLEKSTDFSWNLLDSYYVDDEGNLIDIYELNDANGISIKNELHEYITFTSDKNNVVSVENGKIVAKNAGIATVTATFEGVNGWQGFTSTHTLEINKYDMSASLVRGDAVLNELISNAINVSHGLQDYRVESKNPGIAEYLDGNKIQTYHTENIAQFRVIRDEDRKYKGLDVTLDLTVKKSGEVCYVLENQSGSAEYSVGQNSNGTYSEIYTLNGEGAYLSFKCKLSRDPNVFHYLVAQYSTSDSGDFYDLSSSIVSTDDGNEWARNSISIPAGTKRIRFKRTAESGATRDFSIYDIYVTRKKELDHQVAGNVLVLDPVNIGQTTYKSFTLKWSTCADEIVLSSSNDLFEVSQTRIDASDGDGNTNIQVTFKGSTTPGTYQAIISIYDQTQVKQLTVTCEVKEKLATEIVYTGAYQYADEDRCIENLFSVKDENRNLVSGAKIELESSNPDILEVCGNMGIYPHCGGEVTLTATYKGDEYRAGATWQKQITVANCIQTIEWDQDFRGYIADKNGHIDVTTILTATADPTGFTVTYELDDEAKKFAKLENGNLVVFGIGTGHIIATAPTGMYGGKMYGETSAMHEIRVRKSGDKCETYALSIQVEEVIRTVWAPAVVKEIGDLPESRMEFYAHTDVGSLNDKLTVKFSVDNQANWTNEQVFNLNSAYDWTIPFVATVPEGATHVWFKTQSSLNTYFNCVTIRQKSYLRANENQIHVEETGINIPFEKQFTVNYSDVNIIQYSVTNNYGMDLTLTPMSEINNDCGDWGSYTFKLTGTCTRPIAEGENIVESITLSTSDGKLVTIPVYILSNTFYFDVQDGNWTESSNWTYQGKTTHGKLPDLAHPSVISKAATITAAEGTYEATTYGVTIEGGSVAIKSTGGLTVGEGGVVAATDGLITIDNTPTGAGFLKVDPRATNKPSSKVTINYTTNAYNSGNPRDEIWQYMGAPGTGMDIVEDEDKTLIYHWSEEKGWEKQNDEQLTPFAGYVFTQNKDKTEASFVITATPIIDDEIRIINLTCTPYGMRGGNVFANSYLAPIDVAKIDPEKDLEGVEGTFYLFNSGSWNQWQSQGGKDQMKYGVSAGQYYALSPKGASLMDKEYDQTTIPPMQGVYVVALNKEAKIELNYEKHVYSPESDNTAMRAPQKKEDNFKRVRLQVYSQNSGADRMYVIQHEDATKGYDYGYDAKNIAAEDQVNIYTSEQGGQMEISVSNRIDSTYIGFQAGSDSEYRLRITSVVGEKLLLKDLETETVVAVEDEVEYTFYATPKSVNNKRFLLIDQLAGEEIEDLVKVYIYDNVVHVLEAPKDSDMAVYSVGGLMMAHYAMGEAPCTVELSGLPTGVYVVRIADKAVKFVCK